MRSGAYGTRLDWAWGTVILERAVQWQLLDDYLWRWESREPEEGQPDDDKGHLSLLYRVRPAPAERAQLRTVLCRLRCPFCGQADRTKRRVFEAVSPTDRHVEWRGWIVTCHRCGRILRGPESEDAMLRRVARECDVACEDLES